VFRLLTGKKIRCEADAVTACEQLHAMGPSLVVLTSLYFDPSAAYSQPIITIIGSLKRMKHLDRQ
jgi:pyridoxal/pyridoxine/pyridoxamine kinase